MITVPKAGRVVLKYGPQTEGLALIAKLTIIALPIRRRVKSYIYIYIYQTGICVKSLKPCELRNPVPCAHLTYSPDSPGYLRLDSLLHLDTTPLDLI